MTHLLYLWLSSDLTSFDLTVAGESSFRDLSEDWVVSSRLARDRLQEPIQTLVIITSSKAGISLVGGSSVQAVLGLLWGTISSSGGLLASGTEPLAGDGGDGGDGNS